MGEGSIEKLCAEEPVREDLGNTQCKWRWAQTRLTENVQFQDGPLEPLPAIRT
jgi:hypothetical protein